VADVSKSGTATVRVTPAPTPVCAVSRTSLEFGSVTVGDSVETSFTITNVGEGTLSGSVGSGCGDFGDIIVLGTRGYLLGTGEQTRVTVRFRPSLEGMQLCNLSLGSSCTDLMCTGTGVAAPLSGEMVAVPAGDFTMGSTAAGNSNELPVHTVYLNAFYIDKYEVTNAQFKSFIDAGGYTTQAFWSAAGWSARTSSSWTLPPYWTTGDYHSGPAWPDFPVVGISWYEAEAYAKFAGKRLPTEAEWEKAARGTDQRTYP